MKADLILHNKFLHEFNTQFYSNLLTVEHLVPNKIHIQSAKDAETSTQNESFNFWGWELIKNGERYLLNDKINGKDVNLSDVLPIRAKEVVKISYKGNVYNWIKTPVSMKFRPQKTVQFNELIKTLCPFEHTNRHHYVLDCMINFAQMSLRTNVRKCTPPGFGKDSHVDTFDKLIGGSTTIETPTLAKLEYVSPLYKHVVINEAVGISKKEWNLIEQFLLATGAHKTHVQKHSRSFHGTKEVLDVHKLSLSIMYNDITDYPDSDKYIDFVTKKAVLDRFPALRMNGKIIQDFNIWNNVDCEQYVQEYFESYRELIGNIIYYIRNINTLQHGWDTSKLNKLTGRAQTNVNAVTKVVDMACDSQTKFDKWMEIINNCMDDYKAMLQYPDNFKEFLLGLGLIKDVMLDIHNIDDLYNHAKARSKEEDFKKLSEFCATVISTDTFIKKNHLLINYGKEKNYGDSSLNTWGDN